ncbi:hypothetical protein L7F22_001428 [Adiantum nelumboides]|nr:hypothetical protein [Adiantum nelumboides]
MQNSPQNFGKLCSKPWELNYASVYHPQSDGQTEQVNQVVEDMLRAYCSREPRKWIQFLPLVEFSYNSSFHTCIGMSPFKALYGQECVSPLNFSDPTIRVEATKKMLEEMGEQTKAIRQDIQAAKDCQKHYADQKRSYRKFKQGDKVFLRVQPKRSHLSLGKFKKLSPRYCGPYEDIKVLSDQAYKLKLPEHIKVHEIFHISLLKPYIPNPNHALDDEEIVMQKQGVLELQPDCILETRERTLRNRTIREHVVKGKDCPTEDVTWEDEVFLCKDFPSFC